MKKVLILLLLTVFLAGCGEMTLQEAEEARFYATQYALDPVNNIPPPKYQTLAAQAGYFLPITQATPTPNAYWTPTMSFYDHSATQIAQQQSVSMTQQASQLQVERERLAAEAAAARAATQAYYAQVTAEAYRIEVTAQARATYMQATANAQGTQMMNTAQAAATATVDKQMRIDATNAAANAATAQVMPTHAIWTQQAVYAIQTIEQGEANKVELAVRRQKLKNGFDALLPWTLTVGTLIVVAYGFGEFVKTRTHQRDEHGRQKLIERRTKDGVIYLKPEALETGMVKVMDDGSIVIIKPIDPKEQSDINRGNQIIEAIGALPTPYAQAAPKLITSMSQPRARVTVTETRSTDAVLDEADQGFLEEAKQ